MESISRALEIDFVLWTIEREKAMDEQAEILEDEGKILCEFRECMNEAEYEGWFSVLDFAGQKTGLMRKMYVCEDCKKFLNGSEQN